MARKGVFLEEEAFENRDCFLASFFQALPARAPHNKQASQ